MFVGFVPIGSPINFPVLFLSSGAPANSSTTPVYRVYGNAGLQPNGTGSLTLKDSKAITAASNATPIVITSAGHGLSTGTVVTITGVVGNTAANGTWTITVIDQNTFSLNTSVGNGAYTSGGTWNVTGLYNCSITPTTGNAYAQGGFYDVLITGTVSSVSVTQTFRFGVL